MAVTTANEKQNERSVFGLGGITVNFDIEADRKERSDELGSKSPVVAHDPSVAPIRSGFGACPICAGNWYSFD